MWTRASRQADGAGLGEVQPRQNDYFVNVRKSGHTSPRDIEVLYL
jgi:hypothetical protein